MQTSWRYLKLLYSRGFALFMLAPLIIAIVAIPEFLQHVAEIRLGMFDNIEHARALANDPQRWAFGYAKLTGLAVGMFAAARFWGTREAGGRWWDLRNVAWVPLAIGLLLFVLPSFALESAKPWLPGWVYWTFYVALSLGTLPLLFTILAALFGDRRSGPLGHYWRDWRWLPLLLLLLIAAYLPGMAAHYGLHRLALGMPKLVVWPLMTLDALVVGLIASLVGAAFSLAHAAARPNRA